jgi:phosphoribosylformylglycinamidine (FGAM) synthase PurS component
MHQRGDLHWHLCIDLVYCEVHDVDVKKELEMKMGVRDERGAEDELQMLEREMGK